MGSGCTASRTVGDTQSIERTDMQPTQQSPEKKNETPAPQPTTPGNKNSFYINK